MCQVPEKFSKFPDWGLEGYVAHKYFGSCLFLSNLLLLAWHLSFPVERNAQDQVNIFQPLNLQLMLVSGSRYPNITNKELLFLTNRVVSKWIWIQHIIMDFI